MGQWPWQRAVALYDMNAYFASVEQKDDPALKNKAVAVTNGCYGRTVIACSYEAKQEGVETGMSWHDATRLCPGLIRRASRTERYQEISRRILHCLRVAVTPDIEVFSIDEAFLDMTGVSHRYPNPESCVRHIEQVVLHASGLNVSVGLSSNKTMSKYAAKRKRPSGLTVIEPWLVQKSLRAIPVENLCGIGPGLQRFFARYGVRTCDQIHHMPVGILRQRFGYLGQKLWWMCQGIDHDPVRVQHRPEKTMGHSKVIASHLQHKEALMGIALHITQRLSKRLRAQQFFACRIQLAMKDNHVPLTLDHALAPATQDADRLYKLFKQFLLTGKKVSYISITAVELMPAIQQQLDYHGISQICQRAQVLDQIQEKFGQHALQQARLLHMSVQPVIPPTWTDLD